MAAGILLKDPAGRFLMIQEKRNGNMKFNFIGGKRECRLDWFNMPRLETAFETASAEFEEEIGEELPTKSYDSVYWFPQSKFLLFVVQAFVNAKSNTAWLTRQEIEEGIQSKALFHEYIQNQLCQVLDT